VSGKRRKLNPGDRYVGLRHYLLNCPAYKTLPGDAVKVLIDVWKRHNGVNNGEISYGVREAKEIGISQSVASRMLEVLIKRGFLVVVRDSAFTVKNRQVRTWRVTAEPYRGEQGTKDFMRWRPDQNLEHSPATGTDSPATGIPRNRITRCSPATGTVRPKNAVSQSLHRDTYRVPGGDASPAVASSEAGAPPTAHDCPHTPGCPLLRLVGETV